MYSDTTAIIPTLNEAGNIGKLLKIINSSYPNIKVIVSDDGSIDRTKGIVNEISKSNKNIKLLDRTNAKIHGLTASVLDAALLAKTKNMVVIDADLQHPPEKIREIIQKLENNDLVIAARSKVVSPWPLQRRLMTKTATNLALLKLKKKVKDPLSGFFGIKAALFKNLIKNNEKRFEKPGYKVLFDILKSISLEKTKIDYIYYNFGERSRGKSKIGRKQIIAFLKSLFK